MLKKIKYASFLVTVIFSTISSMEVADTLTTSSSPTESLSPASSRRSKLTRSLSIKETVSRIIPRSLSDEKYKSRRRKKHNSDKLSHIKEETRLPHSKHNDSMTLCFDHLTEDTVNAQYSHKDTALIYATRNNNISLVQTLLNFKKIDPNLKNTYGKAAFHYAAQHGFNDIIKLFLDDVRFNASLRVDNNKTDDANQTIQSLYNKSQSRESAISRALFTRMWIEQLIDSYFSSSTKEDMPTLFDYIQEKIAQDTQLQPEEDRALPQTVLSYDDNETFIEALSQRRLLYTTNL